MKLSARNILRGKIVAIKKGPISALVTIQVAPNVEITASITSNAVEELIQSQVASASAQPSRARCSQARGYCSSTSRWHRSTWPARTRSCHTSNGCTTN